MEPKPREIPKRCPVCGSRDIYVSLKYPGRFECKTCGKDNSYDELG